MGRHKHTRHTQAHCCIRLESGWIHLLHYALACMSDSCKPTSYFTLSGKTSPHIHSLCSHGIKAVASKKVKMIQLLLNDWWKWIYCIRDLLASSQSQSPADMCSDKPKLCKNRCVHRLLFSSIFLKEHLSGATLGGRRIMAGQPASSSSWFHFTGWISKDSQHLKSLTALHASHPERPLHAPHSTAVYMCVCVL